MDGKAATEMDYEVLKRIVATLLSLAALAERVSRRSRPVRCLVLWILRPAEAAAREFVADITQIPQQNPDEFYLVLARSGDSSAEAISLALRFRAMARALDELAQQAPHFSFCGSLEHHLSRLETGLFLDMPRPGLRWRGHLQQAQALLRRLAHDALPVPPPRLDTS